VGPADGRGGLSRGARLAALLLVAIWVLVGSPASLTGCTPETRYRVLSTVFDGVPPPGTPPKERRRRRMPPPEEPLVPSVTDVTPEDLLEQPEPWPDYESYEALLAALPKDTMGNLDWVAAVEDGSIRPRPGRDPEAEEAPILPFDVRLDPGIPQFEVVFPHAAHTYWLRCDSCHPAIFRMKAGSNPITMAKIFEGEYCGKCHGKVAFPPETGCPRCHVKLGG
jgi:c(7)-type cytochrome triheme protein